MSAGRHNGSKRFWFAALLGGMTLMLLAGASEIAIRLTHPNWSQPRLRLSTAMTHDPVLGWTGTPGYTGEVGPERTFIRINAQGYRDEDFDEKQRRSDREGRSRILFIGDSLTYGYRIEESERLSEQAEAVAAIRGRAIETFNAGIPGYGTGQEFRALERLLPTLRPHVVVLWYCSNDVGDSAVPYDYRLAHRVYKPFYDLEGRLLHHPTVPTRFSYRMQDTWLGGWQICYLIDWAAYRREDRRFAPAVHLWDSPLLAEPVPLTPEARSLVALNLGAMAQVPELLPMFDVNKRRNLALWQRMQELCRSQDVRFLMVFDRNDGTVTTPAILETVRQCGIETVSFGERLDPYRPWGGVWGDGHPNAVQNYVAAVTVTDYLEQSETPIDFSLASWIDDVPGTLDLRRSPFHHLLFGEWGRFSSEGREAGSQAMCILRPPPAGRPARIHVRGRSREKEGQIRLWCNGIQVVEAACGSASPFELHTPVPDEHNGLLFLRIEAEPHVVVEEVGVRPFFDPADSE